MDTVSILIGSFVLFIIYWIFKNKHPESPPGPIGFPIIGYIPFMSRKPYLDFQRLAEKYGPIYSVQLGTQNVIVLSDYETIKTAYAQDAFMGRPTTSPFHMTEETIKTEAVTGLPWKEQRRFSLQILRDLGFGKSKMEDHIREEIHELLDHIDTQGGRPTILKVYLTSSMSNNIATLMFGRRLAYDDPERKQLNSWLEQIGKAAGQAAWQLFFPELVHVLRFLKVGAGAPKSIQEFRAYVQDIIKKRENTLDENNIQDYIDGYLLEIKKRKEKSFNKGVLEDLVGTFFGAGSETVRVTVDWLSMAMAAHPNIQQKIQQEIDNVIGRDRDPSWSDYVSMIYTQATIMELMRWRPIVPINPLRYTLWDTQLNGYFIPKHSYVLSSIWSVHKNPVYFGPDVDEFRPERFLNDKGEIDQSKAEYFMPFSVGKRSCPGESYAKVEVFLYFTSLLQKFNITIPEGKTINFEGDLGISLMPKPQELCFAKRS